MTPCKDEADFAADTVMHSWCDFNNNWPTTEDCTEAGCHAWEEEGEDGVMLSRCNCDGMSACTALGGTPHQRTCGDDIKHWGDSALNGLLHAAEKNGTCEGVTTPWGEDVTQWLRHPALKCCKSFPKTVCDKTAKLQTPCASDDDFEPDSLVHNWCDYKGKEPSHWQCEKKGFCHCHVKGACDLFKGTWHQQTCSEYSIHWDEGFKTLQKAKKLGTCEGVKMEWGPDLAEEIKHAARRCCKTAPKTACSAMNTPE